MYTFLARTVNGFVPARSLIHASGDSLQGIPAYKIKYQIKFKTTNTKYCAITVLKSLLMKSKCLLNQQPKLDARLSLWLTQAEYIGTA